MDSPPGLRSRAPGGRGEPRARTSYGPGPSSPRSRRPVPRSRPASQPGGLRVAGPIRLPGPPAGRGQCRARLAPVAREGEPERGRSGTRQPPPQLPAVVRHASALARRLEPVFCSARMLSTKAGDNVISGHALETQTRRARRKVSYLARTSRHRGQPRAWVQAACSRSARSCGDGSRPVATLARDNGSASRSWFQIWSQSWQFMGLALPGEDVRCSSLVGHDSNPGAKSQHSTPRRARCSASSARARWSQVLTVPTGRSRLWAISS